MCKRQLEEIISCQDKCMGSNNPTFFFFTFGCSLHLILSCSLLFSSQPSAWHFKPQHPSTDTFTVPPLDISKPSRFGLSGFMSKSFCFSDGLISDPTHPRLSQREPQHHHFCFFSSSVLLSLKQTTRVFCPVLTDPHPPLCWTDRQTDQ